MLVPSVISPYTRSLTGSFTVSVMPYSATLIFVNPALTGVTAAGVGLVDAWAMGVGAAGMSERCVGRGWVKVSHTQPAKPIKSPRKICFPIAITPLLQTGF